MHVVRYGGQSAVLNRRHADLVEGRFGVFGKTQEHFSFVFGRFHGTRHVAEMLRKHSGGRFVRFKIVVTDPGSQPGFDFCRIVSQTFPQARHRLLDDARGQTAPAGVHGRDTAPLSFREKHRQAVRHLHDAHDARRHRRRRIGFNGIRVD